MSKRLQVLVDDAEFQTFERLARLDDLTTAEWVRRRLREAAAAGAPPNTESRLAAIRTAYHTEDGGPSPDIDQMLDELERGFLGQMPTTRA